MAESNEPRGYQTYVLESVSSINTCLRIAVYNRRAFEQITLYNLEEVYNSLGNAKRVLTRENPNSEFVYTFGDLNNGFNVVIYLSEQGKPIGYTEFYSDQGLKYDVNLKINLYEETKEETELEITTSYSSLRGTGDAYRKFEWKSIEELKKEIDKKHDFRYTSVLTKHGGIIYQGVSSCIDNELYGIKITRGVEIDPAEKEYTNFSLSMWAGDDIILGSWNTSGDYRVVSLTKNDYFGNPVQYFLGGADQEEGLPNPEEVLYMSGKYAVYSDGLYNLKTREWVSGDGLVSDPLDCYGSVYSQPGEFDTYEDVLIKIPSLKNIYIDLKKFMQLQPLKIVRKFGPWWILEHSEKSRKIYALTCDRGLIYLTKEEISNLYILNSGAVLVKNPGEGKYLLYLIPGQGGLFVSKKAQEYMNTESGDWELPDYVPSENTLQEPQEVLVGEEFKSSALWKFRKGPYVEAVPEILGSIYGLILYKDKDNKIFYL